MNLELATVKVSVILLDLLVRLGSQQRLRHSTDGHSKRMPRILIADKHVPGRHSSL